MAISVGLAQLSESLVTVATGTYTVAMAAYTGEYAFGRRGRIASTALPVPQREPVAAGRSGAPAGASPGQPTPPTRYGSGVVVEPGADAGRWWGRVAVTLTVLAAALHAAAVTIRGAAVDRVPWGNMYEFTLVVGLIAVLAWLALLVKLPGIRYLGLFVMLPVLLVTFLAGTLYTQASKLVPALQSYWLAIHVSSVAIAEGILMTSAALTILYLVRNRYERAEAAPDVPATRRMGALLPAATTLDKAAYRTAAFAFPIYTAGVIFGAIWAEAAWGRYWGWDPKETWAFIAWVIYAMYLHARATAGWKGNRAAYINLLGFAAMTFNFFVVNIVISGLHSYAGLS
jgi:cytochrome c-type biogenesis protein CcsB